MHVSFRHAGKRASAGEPAPTCRGERGGNWGREGWGFPPWPNNRRKNNVAQWLEVYFERSRLVLDPLKGAYGNQAKPQEVASSKTSRGLPGLPVLICSVEADIEHGAFLGFLPPNVGADSAMPYVVDGLVFVFREGRLVFHNGIGGDTSLCPRLC